jgi:hypothetical protein
MEFQQNDGGRSKYFKGEAGDCVIRSIAIATGKDYLEVYNDLFELNKKQKGRLRGASPRDGGTKMRTIKKYLEKLGWKWHATMKIGSGCQVHLRKEELPAGRLIVRASKHLTAVIDGVINDTYDPSRNGTRCVYGYWAKD